MKDKYNFQKKKTNITCAPPLDWPWYEKLYYLFASIIKINGVLEDVD
jgi:hypothetical protein